MLRFLKICNSRHPLVTIHTNILIILNNEIKLIIFFFIKLIVYTNLSFCIFFFFAGRNGVAYQECQEEIILLITFLFFLIKYSNAFK